MVVGGDEELWPRLADQLHPYVLDALAGRIDVDVQNETAGALQDKLGEIQQVQQRQRQDSLIERLRQGLAKQLPDAVRIGAILRSDPAA